MESADVFERTEEWARTIRNALDAPCLQAEASADESEQIAVQAPDQVHTPSRSRIQPQTPDDTPVLTPSRTRIILKADSVAESTGTMETIQTIPTLATLESTFEATLHARAMRAAGADLDAPTPVKAVKAPRATFALYGGGYDDYDDDSGRRRTARRDSMKLREALVRGQEGTRQRRRWENDHLMHVPNAQLPLPSDWQVHPTHPVHHNLPYHVAQFWDRGLCKYVNETRAAAAVLRRNQIIAQQSGISVDKAFQNQMSKSKANGKGKPRMPKGPGSVISVATSEAGSEFSTFHVPASTIGLVTRQLRVAAKRTPAVKLWVRAIEVPIRQYVVSESIRLSDLSDLSDLGGSADGQSDNGVAVNAGDDEEFAVESDSEDEVVFIGRRILQQKTESWKRCPTVSSDSKAASANANADDDDDAASDTTISPTAEGILFDDLGEGERGSFKRWLAHSLSDYYGLTSTSSTVDSPGKPGNRVVYMSLRPEATQPDSGPVLIPRPMWELFDL